MKKLIATILAFILPALAIGAVTVPWSRPSIGIVSPLYTNDTVVANIFQATSTTATSTFPQASTTALTIGTLNGLLKAISGSVTTATAGVDYLTPTYASSTYVPYTGATTNLAMGLHDITFGNNHGVFGGGLATSLEIDNVDGTLDLIGDNVEINAATDLVLTLAGNNPTGLLKATAGSVGTASDGTDYLSPLTGLPLSGGTMTGQITLATNSAVLAPLKFVSGTLLSSPVAGTMEFSGDKLSITRTTGAVRDELVQTAGLTNGLITYGATCGSTVCATNNANLTYTSVTNLGVTSGATGAVIGTFKNAVGQTADAIQTQDSGGNALARMDATGAIYAAGGAVQSTITSGLAVNSGATGNAADAFNVKGDTDTNLILTDAANDRVAIGTSTPNSKLSLGGSFSLPYAATSTNYAISASDYLIDYTSGTATTTLPTAVGIVGRVYVIKNSGTGSVVIDTTASQTIDGQTTMLLGVQYESLTVMSNGANWLVI